MKDRRVTLFLVMLGVFMAWLSGVMLVFWKVFNSDKLEDGQKLIVALGIGGITQFFILALTLGWQFFFRKQGPPPTPPKGKT